MFSLWKLFALSPGGTPALCLARLFLYPCAGVVWLPLSNGGGLSRKSLCSRGGRTNSGQSRGCKVSSLRVSGCFQDRPAQVWWGYMLKLASKVNKEVGHSVTIGIQWKTGGAVTCSFGSCLSVPISSLHVNVTGQT